MEDHRTYMHLRALRREEIERAKRVTWTEGLFSRGGRGDAAANYLK